MESNSYIFNSKKALVTFSVFVSVLIFMSLALDRLMVFLDSNSNIGRSISENKQIYGNYDILAIGDSRTHQGVDSNVLSDILSVAKK